MSASEIALGLIANADHEQVLANSYKNFHAFGVDYLNLHRSPELTIKLYLFDPDVVKENADGLVVAPHDHSYNFQTHVLYGEVENVVFQERDSIRFEDRGAFDGTDQYYRVRYRSPISSGSSPAQEFDSISVLDKVDSELYEVGESYYMANAEIHSIWVPTSRPTCLLLFQYRNAGKPHTRVYTRTADPITYDGLYQKFTPGEVAERLDEVVYQLTS